MATPYEIPLSPQPQQLQITLGGKLYTLTVKWNYEANNDVGSWTLDIADGSGNLLVGGIALVTGCDLLGQYGYLSFGGKLYCETDFALTTPPTFTNLGTTGHLFFVTTP